MDRAIIIASGPSLTAGDAEVVMASGWPVIAVNSSWQRVPRCDVIYAGDLEWWEACYHGIDSLAQKWTCNVLAAQRYCLQLHTASGAYNSGARAIAFAVEQGAKSLILLGFDCCIDAGSHWHGDHPSGLRNPDASSVKKWHRHFERLRPLLDTADIINCSRHTAIRTFRCLSLEDALRKESGGGGQ